MARSLLKWAGGKGSIIAELKKHLGPGSRLIEPFVGAGNVFINAVYPTYLLNDINQDLIDVYRCLQDKPDRFIDDLRDYFMPDENTPESYARNRDQFNALVPGLPGERWLRAVLFVYLNRHCFNGICRYNQAGGFNVPYGRYKKPYFPEVELWNFAARLQTAVLTCGDFSDAIAKAGPGDVVYCDPPYLSASETVSFTEYHRGGFTVSDHNRLFQSLYSAACRGARVIISNSDTPATRCIYACAGFEFHELTARRSVAANGNRAAANELIITASFSPSSRPVWVGVDFAKGVA